jgi:hypothetical protein
MPIHTCARCNYSTQYKANLEKHLQSNVPCACVDEAHNVPREQLLSELRATKRRYGRKEPPQQAILIQNNIHIHMSPDGWMTAQGRRLNAFGQEDETHITRPLLMNIVRNNIDDIEKACLELIWRIWFSKDHPQNHNALFRNWHDQIAYVLDSESGRFEYNNAEEVMRRMLRWVRQKIAFEMEESGSTVFSEHESQNIIAGLNDLFRRMKDAFPRKEMDKLLLLATAKTREVFPYEGRDIKSLLA